MLLTHDRKGGRHVVVATLAVLATCGLTACGSAVGSDSSSTKNLEQWSMPLDEFRSYPPELSNYAEQLLIARCLTEQGYEWPVPWQDTDFPRPEGVNDAGNRLFDTGIAEKWGYHSGPPRDEEAALKWIAFGEFANSYAPDAAFDAAYDVCADGAREDQTLEDIDGFNYISDLSLQASLEAEHDETVQSAVDDWQACLTPRVDFAVPDDPLQMPPLEVAERLKVYGPESTPTPSPEEIAIALADAECRESSGLSATRYDVEWEAQTKLVEQNRDQLERIRSEALAHKKKLLTVIAENAPAAP